MNSTTANSRFLDLNALSALAHMRFTTRHRIEGSYSGRHQSRQQGGAGEFVDYRQYSGSEDLRRLDWKVLGRTGKSFVRLYQDETNLLCTLALDVSGSMRFGVRSHGPASLTKLEYAQYLATAMSYIIVHGQDQIGLAVLDHGLRTHLPPGGTLSHLARVHETIEKLPTQRTTKMAQGLNDLFERSKRRGVLLLMSDFLMDDLSEVFAAVKLFRHRNWEVAVLHLVHPDEERLPEGTAFRFEGMEGEGRLNCSPTEVRAAYQQRFQQHLAMVRQFALAGGSDYRLVSTGIPYLHTLGGFLVDRAA
jgi:uncharacterized protein (DUF58 family)